MTKPLTKSIRALGHPAVWSNAVLIAPVILAGTFNDIPLLILLSGVLIVSVLYHWLSERDSGTLLRLDETLASIVALYSAGLVAFGAFKPPYSYAVLVFVFLGVFFNALQRRSWKSNDTERYELYHAWWHVCASLVVSFSLLTFYG